MPEKTTERPEKGSLWKHLKTGGIYRVVGIGKREADCVPCVVYQVAFADKDAAGDWWIRTLGEFADGRFEAVPEEGPR